MIVSFDFHSENDSIIYSFHTVAPNNLQPSWCTQLIKSFSKVANLHDMKHCGLGDLNLTKQNKTNYLAS
jgi:hypothetical protein